MDLYQTYRPKKLEDIIGQEQAVGMMQSWLKAGKVPHVILASGPSGTGKTTACRILRREMKCSKADFMQINVADSRGIDAVRQITERVSMMPIGGPCRIWFLDECHAMTSTAQDAILKLLEDYPPHAWFFLATTEPQKIKDVGRTRMSHLRFRSLTDEEVAELVQRTAKAEGKPQDDCVVDKVVQASNGSARQALVWLGQVIDLPTNEEKMEAIIKADTEKQAEEICNALMNPKTKWSTMVGFLKDVDKNEIGQMRRMLLGRAAGMLLGSMAARAYLVIDSFDGDDDWKIHPKASFYKACYDVLGGK